MGCFSIQCGVTNTLIDHYDDMVTILFTNGTGGQQIASLPYVGKYNDYGMVEEVEDNAASRLSHFALKKYIKQLREGFTDEELRLATTSNAPHLDTEDPAQGLEFLEGFIRENAVALPPSHSSINIVDLISRENKYHPRINWEHESFKRHWSGTPQELQFFRMHKYAYDELIHLCPLSEFLHNEDALVGAMNQAKAAVIELIEKIGGDDAIGLLIPDYLNNYDKHGIISYILNPSFSGETNYHGSLARVIKTNFTGLLVKWAKGDESGFQALKDMMRAGIEIMCFKMSMQRQNLQLHEATIYTSSQHSEPGVMVDKILFLRKILEKQEKQLSEYFTENDWTSESMIEIFEKYGPVVRCSPSGKCSEEVIQLVKEIEAKHVGK